MTDSDGSMAGSSRSGSDSDASGISSSGSGSRSWSASLWHQKKNQNLIKLISINI